MGTLGGSSSSAQAISANGAVVVGSSMTSLGNSRAFRWTEAGGMIDLGTLGGNESGAQLLSADGEVAVGWSYTTSGERHIFRWTQAGGMMDLGTLGGNVSQLRAITPDGANPKPRILKIDDPWFAANVITRLNQL